MSLVDRRTTRLIASANHKPPVLERLVSSFGARSALELLESVTSGRLNPTVAGGGTMPASVAGAYGRTYVNAAFAYPRPRGNRFSPPAWGAWYSAFAVETALAEISFHLTRALTAAGCCYDNTTRYVELMATFRDEFLDLRDVEPLPVCLHADEDPGYVEGQRMAQALRVAGGNGIVYPSVRHPGGVCLVAFWPQAVTEFQQGGLWELTWTGSPTPRIDRLS